MSEYLSYGQLIKDRMNFRSSGTYNGDLFNIYDTPSKKYFKILFYFGNSSYTSNKYIGQANGLLHPTWEIFNKDNSKDGYIEYYSDESENLDYAKFDDLKYYDYNTAWSFLKLNDENERADKLEKFVTLLSNINSCSPWYFNSISGLDSALERKVADTGKLEIAEPGKITIGCLPDAYDNRIGTLLELYRDITWSWHQKKEIIPANLRKFDMAIYIFETPTHFLHDENDIIGTYNEKFNPSYKMIEFHDCEFGYNSIKSGWSELTNEAGASPKYTIEISYGDCFEGSFNEQLMKHLGDVILTDTYQAALNDENLNTNTGFGSYASMIQDDGKIHVNELNRRKDLSKDKDAPYIWKKDAPQKINLKDTNLVETANTDKTLIDIKNIGGGSYKRPKGSFIERAGDQLFNVAKNYVERKFTRAILGNLYTYSLTKISDQIDSFKKGDVLGTAMSVKQYINNAQQRAAAKLKNAPNNKSLYNSGFESNDFIGAGNSFGNLENSSTYVISPSTIANN